jgi:hypothetical protein
MPPLMDSLADLFDEEREYRARPERKHPSQQAHAGRGEFLRHLNLETAEFLVEPTFKAIAGGIHHVVFPSPLIGFHHLVQIEETIVSQLYA